MIKETLKVTNNLCFYLGYFLKLKQVNTIAGRYNIKFPL